MSLLSLYQAQIKSNTISSDTNQLEVIKQLDYIKSKLEQDSSSTNLFSKVYCKLLGTNVCKGLYLYSGVGRGKTMLMDMFFNNLLLNPVKKHRVHFHLFMKTIHEQMQQVVGVRDPIDYIIKKQYSLYRVLCLDEFLVHDIADAMLLSNILKALFKYNILLITTSNTKPDLLYKNGLQRESFLPAIQLILDNLTIMHLEGDTDYRAKMLLENNCYFYPQNEFNYNKLTEIYTKLSVSVTNLITIEIANRLISVIKASDNLVWFDFNIICQSPRSQHDYLEIAELYKVILLSDLIQLDDSKQDMVRRFINFIDVLYDYKVKLIISAHVPLDNIYIGLALAVEFKRTISRLKEMQTQQYMGQAHL
jgi:cell division protein ZapE